MRRKDKYPNTDVFQFYNANPLGRFADDCVVRAICMLIKETWGTTMQSLTNLALQEGRVLNEVQCYSKFLEKMGYIKMAQPRCNGWKISGRSFVRQFKGECVMHIGSHHLVYVNGGKIYDTHDCSEYAVGNFWIKPTDMHLLPKIWHG